MSETVDLHGYKVRVSVESKRGCGFRKPGALYLVAPPGEFTMCGRLPLPMHVCPVCGSGVKPCRGWTWVRPQELFANSDCRSERSHCATCVLRELPERAGLIWVGGMYYQTPDLFLREAKTLGVSRRITAIPKGFVPGKTVVLLAHRKVPQDGVLIPAVFSAFVPRSIEYVITGEETKKQIESLLKRGVELVKVEPLQRTLPFGDGGWKVRVSKVRHVGNRANKI